MAVNLRADDGALGRILADGELLLPGGTLDQLSGAVEPLGALAGRLPGSRRRALD